MSVKYLFYGDGSTQITTAKRAEATLKLLPDVNTADNCFFDQRIADFTIASLSSEKIDAEALAEAVRLDMEASSSSSDKRCSAFNFPNDDLKRRRCSGHAVAGSDLCRRHKEKKLKEALLSQVKSGL